MQRPPQFQPYLRQCTRSTNNALSTHITSVAGPHDRRDSKAWLLLSTKVTALWDWCKHPPMNQWLVAESQQKCSSGWVSIYCSTADKARTAIVLARFTQMKLVQSTVTVSDDDRLLTYCIESFNHSKVKVKVKAFFRTIWTSFKNTETNGTRGLMPRNVPTSRTRRRLWCIACVVQF